MSFLVSFLKVPLSLIISKEIAVFCIILGIIVATRFGVSIWYKKRKKLTRNNNFIIGINNITFLLFLIWSLLFILYLCGVTVHEFLTSLSILAAAIAILFKEYIVNGLNGMIIMFGDNLEIGDKVKIGSNKGIVQNITLLNVQLLSEEEDLVIVPNSEVVSNNFINYSKNPKNYSTLDFDLPVKNSIAIEKLKQACDEVFNNYFELIKEDSTVVRVLEIKKDSTKYRIRFSLAQYNRAIEIEIRQALWQKILLIIQ